MIQLRLDGLHPLRLRRELPLHLAASGFNNRQTLGIAVDRCAWTVVSTGALTRGL